MIRIKNDAKSAEVYISGDIIDDVDGEEIKAWYGNDASGYKWPDSVKRDLDAIDDDAPLTIYINSDGGSVPAGVAIANMIARHKGKTTAVVDGWCCSIATQIFRGRSSHHSRKCISHDSQAVYHRHWRRG